MTERTLTNLLEGVVDYAGLFPPAELPLEEAVANYRRYLADDDVWMLGRFICPVGRLPELAALVTGGDAAPRPFEVSVLFRGGPDPEAFEATFREDLTAIAGFREASSARARVGSGEVRVPASIVDGGDAAAMGDHLAEIERAFGEHGGPLPLFHEVATIGPDVEARIPPVVAGIASRLRRREGARAVPVAGYKLRTGGVTDDAFPTTEEVAFAIACCRDHGVAMKFTAGLHHPLRHFNEGQGVRMHGFLNVFTAVVMAWSQKLSADRVRQILDDESPTSFSFDGDRLSWKGYTVPVSDVARLREAAATSFGSCSFDEPRDDLRALAIIQ